MADNNTTTTIPYIDFSREVLGLDDKERWKQHCHRVREACESHGCFIMKHDDGFVSSELREDMLFSMKQLFDLPEETKNRYVCPKPYRSYLGKCPMVPFQESFGVDNASNPDVCRDFTTLMWPDGNPLFWKTVNRMSTKMLELNFLIVKMILESFGVERQHCDSLVEANTSILRLMKYNYKEPNTDVLPRSSSKSTNIGLVAHTDKSVLTIVCQNEVQGLQVQSKGGHDWIDVMVPHNAFVVFVGDILKAWSNGRLHAARHRVIVNGEKERYSWGLFSMPKDGTTIKVAHELVDNEHPLLYRPFNFDDYISFFISKLNDDALDIYAAL